MLNLLELPECQLNSLGVNSLFSKGRHVAQLKDNRTGLLPVPKGILINPALLYNGEQHFSDGGGRPRRPIRGYRQI